MVDLLRWNNSAIWSNVSHTVSLRSVTSIFDVPSGVVYNMIFPLSSIILHVKEILDGSKSLLTTLLWGDGVLQIEEVEALVAKPVVVPLDEL